MAKDALGREIPEAWPNPIPEEILTTGDPTINWKTGQIVFDDTGEEVVESAFVLNDPARYRAASRPESIENAAPFNIDAEPDLELDFSDRK